jgi:hypothetical protein
VLSPARRWRSRGSTPARSCNIVPCEPPSSPGAMAARGKPAFTARFSVLGARRSALLSRLSTLGSRLCTAIPHSPCPCLCPCRYLSAGSRHDDRGRRSMVSGPWSVVSGPWSPLVFLGAGRSALLRGSRLYLLIPHSAIRIPHSLLPFPLLQPPAFDIAIQARLTCPADRVSRGGGSHLAVPSLARRC